MFIFVVFPTSFFRITYMEFFLENIPSTSHWICQRNRMTSYGMFYCRFGDLWMTLKKRFLMKMTWGGDCFVLFGGFFFSSFGSVIVNSLLLLSLLGVTPKMILEMVYNLEGWLFTIPICQRILGQDAEPWVTSIRSLTLWMSY